jgi:hypothetical protein
MAMPASVEVPSREDYTPSKNSQISMRSPANEGPTQFQVTPKDFVLTEGRGCRIDIDMAAAGRSGDNLHASHNDPGFYELCRRVACTLDARLDGRRRRGARDRNRAGRLFQQTIGVAGSVLSSSSAPDVRRCGGEIGGVAVGGSRRDPGADVVGHLLPRTSPLECSDLTRLELEVP